MTNNKSKEFQKLELCGKNAEMLKRKIIITVKELFSV